MKTIQRNGLLLALTFLFCSCQTMGFFTSKDMMAIEKGMTRQEVYKRLKNPDYRSFTDDEEDWEYRLADGRRMRITFYKEKVIALDTYTLLPPCRMSSTCATSTLLKQTPDMKKVIILLSVLSISFFLSSYPAYGNTTLSEIERGSVTRKPQPGRKGEMDPEQFSEFLNRLKEAPFKRQKMELLDTVLPYTRFSSLQCKEIANAFTFTSEKKEVLKKLYPYRQILNITRMHLKH